MKLLAILFLRRYQYCYMTIATSGAPFLKDSLLVLWLRVFGVRRIFHLHGKGIKNQVSGSKIKRWYYNFIFKRSTVIHLSESLFADLDPYINVKDRYVLPNGIKTLGMKRRRNGIINLLYLSNFFESKGALKLLKACKLLDEKGKSFRLNMIGGWPHKKFKKEIMEFYNSINWNNNISIMGPLYNKEKNEMIQNSDILVFPSTYELECFPLVILEAMSCGKCIISSREGAIPDILEDGETGVFIDPENIEEFSNTLATLLNTPGQIEQIGQNAFRKFQSNFTLEIFEERWKELITKIISMD